MHNEAGELFQAAADQRRADRGAQPRLVLPRAGVVRARLPRQGGCGAAQDQRAHVARPGGAERAAVRQRADVRGKLRRGDPAVVVLACRAGRRADLVRLRALQSRRGAGTQQASQRCRPVPGRGRHHARRHPGTGGAQGSRQPGARLRLSAGRSAGARPPGTRAGAPQWPVLEQGAARHRLGQCGLGRLPGGTHAVAGAAQPRRAGCGGAGVLSGGALRLRQAERQRAVSRILRERRQVLRYRECPPR